MTRLATPNCAAIAALHKAGLDSATAQIVSLPDGEEQEDKITKKIELKLCIRKLSKSESGIGAIAILETGYGASLQERQIARIDAFIAAINDRKAQL